MLPSNHSPTTGAGAQDSVLLLNGGIQCTSNPTPTKSDFTYFQNCRIPATDADRVTTYKDMLSLNADVIGLAETCLNSRTQITRMQVNDDFT
jgi:hypothetical protein